MQHFLNFCLALCDRVYTDRGAKVHIEDEQKRQGAQESQARDRNIVQSTSREHHRTARQLRDRQRSTQMCFSYLI